MFFRRGRLSAAKARALLIELLDQRYQWPLRTPVGHWSARTDPLSYLCSLRSLVDGTGEGLYLLNRRRPPERTPWFGDDLAAAVGELTHGPAELMQRLMTVMQLDDPMIAEVEMRRLLLEIIDLTPREKKQGQQEKEQPAVAWLHRVADLDSVDQPPDAPEARPADLKRAAQRAVRIVWRLPGSRLAALTGPVAAGHTDRASSIEISLFGLKLPDPAVRRSLIASTASVPDDITQLTQEKYAADTFWLEDPLHSGIVHLVDVRYFLLNEAERLIKRPAPESRADVELLAHLSTAKVLVDYEFRGPDLLSGLQEATREARPERTSRALESLARALAYLEASSQSPNIFYATTDAVLALFQLLAARNDRWITFPEGAANWLDGLEHAPTDVHRRLSAVALLPFRRENVAAKLETLRALEREARAL